MRRLHENRFYRDDALTPENITTIFEAFGWTSIRDWMGRDDDLTFVKGSDRISFDYNPRAGYDFIYYKDFDKNEYSSDYMMYAGVNCAELENDCRDFDKLQATDFLKYKAPQLFMLGDSKPVPVLTESRLRRARLQEADKSRFIIPVWNEVDERGLWSDVKRNAGYATFIDTNDVELPTQAALIKFVNSGANDKFNNTDWNKFKVNPDTRPDTKPGGNIDYDHLQYHVQLLHPADIRELCRNSKDGETDLDLGVIRMMPTSKNGAVISRESTFHPKLCFMGFENVHVKAIWLKYNTPLITFQNCGNVVIDTIYMPRPDDPKGHKEFLESGNTLGAVKDNDCEISFSGCLDVDIKNVKIIPFSKFSVMDINSVYSPDEYGSHFVTLDDLDHKVTNITKNMVVINLNNISNHDIPSADQKNKVFFIDEAIEVSDNITRIQIFNLPIGWEVAWNKELGRDLRVDVYYSTN